MSIRLMKVLYITPDGKREELPMSLDISPQTSSPRIVNQSLGDEPVNLKGTVIGPKQVHEENGADLYTDWPNSDVGKWAYDPNATPPQEPAAMTVETEALILADEPDWLSDEEEGTLADDEVPSDHKDLYDGYVEGWRLVSELEKENGYLSERVGGLTMDKATLVVKVARLQDKVTELETRVIQYRAALKYAGLTIGDDV